MTNGPIKKHKSHKALNKEQKKRRNKQILKNEQYKASQDYSFAEPGSAKELRAKIKFTNATKLLKKHREKK